MCLWLLTKQIFFIQIFPNRSYLARSWCATCKLCVNVVCVCVSMYTCFVFLLVHWPTGPPNSDLDDLGSVSFFIFNSFRMFFCSILFVSRKRGCVLKSLWTLPNQYNNSASQLILPRWNPRPTSTELSTPAGPHALLLCRSPHFSPGSSHTFSHNRALALARSFFLSLHSCNLTVPQYPFSLALSFILSFLVSQQIRQPHRKERHAAYTTVSHCVCSGS